MYFLRNVLFEKKGLNLIVGRIVIAVFMINFHMNLFAQFVDSLQVVHGLLTSP